MDVDNGAFDHIDVFGHDFYSGKRRVTNLAMAPLYVVWHVLAIVHKDRSESLWMLALPLDL
ncbi:MAG: hypothetical protein HGA47_01620 [Zoogloea sp.]|nr:hypothetical protein [Zoogloea sp.]